MQHIAFTICSNNFFSYALSFADSLVEKNNSYHVVIGLADKRSDTIDYHKFAPHEVISIDEVGIGNLPWMTEHYNIVELNTAVKPFYFEYLFKKYNPEHILFFDPDIFIYDTLDQLTCGFTEHDVLLTPHVINPIPKGVYPWENHFLNHGLYNLGFIGLKNTPNVMALLKWWQDRCAEHCISDYRQGLYVDQLWANFMPLFFSKVHIDKNPGHNVAFWNLHERELAASHGKFSVNGKPLIFFHFSAFNPAAPERLTRENYTNLDYRSNLHILELLKQYKNTLIAHHYDSFSKQKFAWANDARVKEMDTLAREIQRKEQILDYLTFRFINKQRLITFMYDLFKDYIAYNNHMIGNINDTRYNNLDYSLHSRKQLELSGPVKGNLLTKIKLLGKSIKSFWR